MVKRDFHFKRENSAPPKRKPQRFKKPNPSPPLNALRNPSAAPPESSPYDNEAEREVMKRVEEIEIDIGQFKLEPDTDFETPEDVDDVKIYSPKNKIYSSRKKEQAEKGSRKLMLIAAALVAVGVLFLGVGLIIGFNYV